MKLSRKCSQSVHLSLCFCLCYSLVFRATTTLLLVREKLYQVSAANHANHHHHHRSRHRRHRRHLRRLCNHFPARLYHRPSYIIIMMIMHRWSTETAVQLRECETEREARLSHQNERWACWCGHRRRL